MARLFASLSLLVAAAAAQSSFSPARPPAIPLAVRSPYLSTWQAAGSDGGNGGYLAGQWPTFWESQNGRIVTGWTGLIRVDNTTYTWLGDPNPLPTVVNQTSFSYTSTRSIFTMDVAGLVTMNVTFLSPVTPDDEMRQSFPVSYMSVEVQSADGNEHNVAIYTDISAEWVSGDRSQVAQWSYGVANSSSTSSRKRSAAPEAHRPWQFKRPHSPAGYDTSSSTSACVIEYVTVAASAASESAVLATYGQSSATSASENSASGSSAAPILTSESASSSSAAAPASAQSPSAGSSSAAAASNSTAAGTTASAATSSGTAAGAVSSGPIVSANATSTSVTVTGTGSATSATGTASANGVAYHRIWRQLQQEFSEENQQASWGYWFYATENVAGLTHQSGADVDVRRQFTSNGVLTNGEDTNYRAINDDYPVYGFAVDLGSVGSESVRSVFSINLAQDLAIQFQGYGAVEQLPSLWTDYHNDDVSAVSFYYNDYDHVADLATELDNQVASDSTSKGGSDYLTLTALAVRQAWGALSLVGNSTTSYIFLKEISSDGDIETVDVIFPFFPIMMYMNPSWMRRLLSPLFINQEAGQFTQGTFSEHDLGKYPNATKPGDEAQPVEECGNMLIMTLAYAQRTGDTGYLNDHYAILNQWTQYLINDSLIPENQISTDDFAGSLANQTNLALKGIIGINAMAVIANMTGHAADGANYTALAQSYISQWQGFGIARDANPPHTTLAYGQNDTHGLLYNLWADALLQTDLVPRSVYQMQSDFYPTVESTYGVPLDTRHNNTKNDWEMFCAAIADTNTTSMFIRDVAKFINQTPTSGPVSDLYDVRNAEYAPNVVFIARPVVGGWFALLALNQTGIPSGSPS